MLIIHSLIFENNFISLIHPFFQLFDIFMVNEILFVIQLQFAILNSSFSFINFFFVVSTQKLNNLIQI